MSSHPQPPFSLAGVFPEVTAEQLVADLVPPPHFAEVRFDTYIADPTQPSQSAAVANLQNFSHEITAVRKFWTKKSVARPGRYLDGGFGVGKTHLLASLWFETDVPKVYGTFVEYTNLVGALGFAQTVELLSQYKLVCIDEFELDDPGDTVLMSTLLMRLVEKGVYLAATSNTLPDRLGEERFAADDFVREIQGLAAHFENLKVDGDDYRHRGLPAAPTPISSDEVVRVAQSRPSAALDGFKTLTHHLSLVHPSKYRKMVGEISALCVTDVETLTDVAQALRWVVLADRLYDRDVPIISSGVSWDVLFAPELLKGGYRKKYRRAVSRLVALSRESA
jgi:cell division protein ZapE